MFADFGPDGNPTSRLPGRSSSSRPEPREPQRRHRQPRDPEPGRKAPGSPARGLRAAQATDADRQLSQLLLGSPWCSFQYSQTSGRTSTSRYTFLPDGTVSFGTNTKAGPPISRGWNREPRRGATGSVYSQSKGGGRLRWKVQQGMLHLDDGKASSRSRSELREFERLSHHHRRRNRIQPVQLND